MRSLFFSPSLTFLLCFSGIKGQAVQYNVIPASCAACCDGSFTITIGVSYGICIPNPTLNLASYTPNTFYYTNVCSGTYTITCHEFPGHDPPVIDYFTMPFSTGLSSSGENRQSISVFPNPASESLFIGISGFKTVRIDGIDGKTIKNLRVGDDMISISDLTPGIYFISVYTNNGFRGRAKLIKN